MKFRTVLLALVVLMLAPALAGAVIFDKAALEKTGTKYSPIKVEYAHKNTVLAAENIIFEVPEDMIPDFDVFVSSGNLFVDGRLKPFSPEVPLLSFVGPITILMSREGGSRVVLDTITPEQSTAGKNRWWFETNPQEEVFFGRHIGNFKVPGTYQVTVRADYKYAGNDFTIGIIFEEFEVAPVDFWGDTCSFSEELVRLRLHFDTLFDVPENTLMNFNIDGVTSGVALAHPDLGNPRSSDAWIWIPNWLYDASMVDQEVLVEVEILGRSAIRFLYFFPNLDVCENADGGKG